MSLASYGRISFKNDPSISYEEFTKEMENKGKLEEELHKIFNDSAKEKNVTTIVEWAKNLYSCDASHPLFEDKEFPLYLLAAFRIDKISDEQFNLLNNFYTYIDYDRKIKALPETPPPPMDPHGHPLQTKEEIEKVYKEVTRGVPDIEKWMKELDGVPNAEERIAELVKVFNEGEWDVSNPIFSHDDFQLLALGAVKKGLISQLQFGTLMAFQNISNYHRGSRDPNPISIPLFIENKPNPVACNIINAALVFLKIGKRNGRAELYENAENGQRPPYHKPMLTPKKMVEFFELMQKFPLSEQQFLVAADIQDTPIYQQKTATASQTICFDVTLNIFSRLVVEKILWRMFPSSGMEQAFLMLTAIDNQPVRLNHRLKESSVYDIRSNCLFRSRDVYTPSKFSPLVLIADGFSAPGDDIRTHDSSYHAVMTNFAPHNHIKSFIALADHLMDLRQINDLGKFWYKVIDMEITMYRPDNQPDDPRKLELLYWITLSVFIRTLKTDNKAKTALIYSRIISFFDFDEEGVSKRGMTLDDVVKTANMAREKISKAALLDLLSLENLQTYSRGNGKLSQICLEREVKQIIERKKETKRNLNKTIKIHSFKSVSKELLSHLTLI